MHASIRTALESELHEASKAEAKRDLPRAWRHLERAHILSQAYAGPHVRVHVRMLGFAARRPDLKELLGQLVRVLVAGPGSWLGRAPLGNTGGSDVGIREPMPIPDDLREILDTRP